MGSVGKKIGKVVGGITGSTASAEGAQEAAETQAKATQIAIDEQKRQFDIITGLFEPYVTAGTGALAEQQRLLGLKGAEEQAAAVSAIEESPYFQAVTRQGENAILQNAAATGGLRGGNVQGALAQFRPNLLNQQIQQQLQNIGGLTQLGQASAARQAGAGQEYAAQTGNLIQQQGAAIAGGQIAAGNAQRQSFSDLLGIGGAIAGFF